ncbi:unnamed protein product, partial [Adineta steineri]
NGRSIFFRDVSRNGCYIDGELIHHSKILLQNSEHIISLALKENRAYKFIHLSGLKQIGPGLPKYLYRQVSIHGSVDVYHEKTDLSVEMEYAADGGALLDRIHKTYIMDEDELNAVHESLGLVDNPASDILLSTTSFDHTTLNDIFLLGLQQYALFLTDNPQYMPNDFQNIVSDLVRIISLLEEKGTTAVTWYDLKPYVRRFLEVIQPPQHHQSQEGIYLDEVSTYVSSTAYIEIFIHLFTRLEMSDQNELDRTEEFYLITCPTYVCHSRKNKSYMEVSREILKQMSSIYVNILMKFTKIMKDCSTIIINPITWLLALLNCTTVWHDNRIQFMNINKDFIDALWIIIFNTSIEQEKYMQPLLIYSLTLMFYSTFDEQILVSIKEKNMVSTLLELLINGKAETIQFEACRLLSIVMNNDDIKNPLMDTKKLIKVFFIGLCEPTPNPNAQIRLQNSLFCLKSNMINIF